MSSFRRTTKHPVTGVPKPAWWLDDHFGPHRYGVQFDDDPTVYEADKHQWKFPNEDEE